VKSLQHILRSGDLSASLVVFLVALPLRLGIAVASGMPPSAGLIASIIGGVLVGSLSGSPLQVSGPAAGLTVLVWNLVEQYGVHGVGAIICVAGVLQMVAGRLGLGRAFQAVSPAVVYGMLAGIGVLLCASQLHVMLDARPYSSGVANLAALPRALSRLFDMDSRGSAWAAAGLGGMTIVILVSWERLRPRALRAVPPALAGVFLASLTAAISGARVSYVSVADDMSSTLTLPRWQGASYGAALVAALSLALVASAETLLCAAAVERMQQRARTNYNRELFAQGLGNALCGLLGGLPITGVIVRSSANVEAGAQTRLSTMLHGLWMLLLVVLAPGVLRLVPTPSLAGVLVYTGVKLVSVAHMRELRGFGWHTLKIYAFTLGLVVGVDRPKTTTTMTIAGAATAAMMMRTPARAPRSTRYSAPQSCRADCRMAHCSMSGAQELPPWRASTTSSQGYASPRSPSWRAWSVRAGLHMNSG
jgi:MFS superfamily sulfate permease-like transporter